MAQPSFPGRNVYSNRLPDRSGPSSSQQPFGQSAPGFGRQTQPAHHIQHTQQPQQPAYGYHPQYVPPAGFGVGRGQAQGQTRATGMVIENDISNLSQDLRDEINEAFNVFDVDRDGYLDMHEFRVALRALGFDVPRQEIVDLISANGVPRSGAISIDNGDRSQPQYSPGQMRISLQAFTRIAAQMIQQRDPLDEVNRAFALFAGDKDYIDLNDLKRVANELGEHGLEDHELQTMIEEFDYQNIGGITREAFQDICTH